MGGWHPRELAYFSRHICEYVATMLMQIEEGAPWPTATGHARAAHLVKEGAAIGGVMSYRPLTITAPVYRAWATVRLRSLEDWITTWALPEMHAGVPEMGAVDVWCKALAEIEEMRFAGAPFCGELPA